MCHQIVIFILIAVISKLDAAPCEVIGGRSELILDVTESNGDDFSQEVSPSELPIDGAAGVDFDLELSAAGKERLLLEGKSLSLVGPLDRDAGSLSTVRFEISCAARATSSVRSIPVVLRVRDLNDNRPEFTDAPYAISVKEDAIVGTPIFNGIKAQDKDVGRNAQVEYQIIGISPEWDSRNPHFSIRFPHQGAVFLMKPLDYEKTPIYQLTILASDNAEDPNDRLNSTTTLTIRVLDVDDQDPVFDTAATPNHCSEIENSILDNCTKEYYSSIIEGSVAGVLDVYPGRIHARDPDKIDAAISYSFVTGTPGNFRDFFSIDRRSAVVKQIAKVDRNLMKKFDIIIQATELAPRRGSTRVRLMINVEKVDTSPPKLIVPGHRGKVSEASPRGTPVLLDDGTERPFTLSVHDPDLDHGEQTPLYVFELTTSAFEINNDGILVVADPDLDRDPPNSPEYSFQVIARERREGGAASAPVTLTVRVEDVNDNTPRLPVLPTVTFPAGSERRKVLQLRAMDIDEGENAEIRYDLVSGSRGKFILDPLSGDLIAVGDLHPGEKFFLNVKATDKGQLSGEGFVEVVISKGVNSNGPVFGQPLYYAAVPENIPYGERVTRVQAVDPEGDSAYYSISGGDGKGLFEIDTLNGLITAVAALDRETKNQYKLEVTAEDSDGKSNMATVEVRVTDVNDVSPFFVGEPYTFRVTEGVGNATVGVVKAEDTDLGVYGEVEYVLDGPRPPFSVDSDTGKITTNASLDYEAQPVHYLPIVARDKARDPRSSTTTVTVLVGDISDEAPTFPRPVYEVRIPENAPVGASIAAVMASDPDTEPMITYVVREGDVRLFSLGPKSGRVSLAAPLDFENATEHIFTVGTLENDSEEDKAKAKITVKVVDVNDEAPILAEIHTVTLPKTAPIHTLVARVHATDRDASAPNNLIEYSLDDEGSNRGFFRIDPKNGEIRLRRLLNDINEPELKIKVKATDEGQPPLWTSAEFRVLLLQNVFGSFPDFSGSGNTSAGAAENNLASLAASPRFSKDHMVLHVSENPPIGTVIAKVPMVSTSSGAVSCTILEGDEDGTFETNITDEGHCRIVSAENIDFEQRRAYNLSLVLHPREFIVSGNEDTSVLSTAIVEIFVKDINDNSPMFVLNGFKILDELPETTVLSYVLQDSPIGTPILTLKAKDVDSGGRGKISFSLVPESNRGNYFSVSAEVGVLQTQRDLFNVPLELQPFNLSVTATDSPTGEEKRSSRLWIIAPTIEETHRSVLIFNSSVDDVKLKVEQIRSAISLFTGKYVQIEELKRSIIDPVHEPRSHLLFHLLDSKTWLPASPSFLHRDEDALNRLSMSVDSVQVADLVSFSHLKLMIEKAQNRENFVEAEVVEEQLLIFDLGPLGKLNFSNFSTLEFSLIGAAGVVILFIVSGLIAACVVCSKHSKKSAIVNDKSVMLIPPTIARPASVIESISKEYEVQVLHMSVPMDDESLQETNVGSSSSRQAYLDNVSYISKSRNNLDCSSSGSSGMGTPQFLAPQAHHRWSPYDSNFHGQSNPGFSGAHLHGGDLFNGCSSNSNVMFARKDFTDHLETTTEL